MSAGELGLLVMSYGTARDLNDVEAYYTHIRRGRPPPPELLAELRERYLAIGGRSPLLDITKRQVAGLEGELARRAEADGGPRFRAFGGMKHQSPYIEDGVRAMAEAGIERAVGIVLAPHYSRFSVGQYLERAEPAAAENGIQMSFVTDYHDHPGFVAFVAQRVRDAIAALPGDVRDGAVVLFSAHSLPARILEAGDPYARQLEETADAVAAATGLGADRYRTAWMSAGRTAEEWLGPDITEAIAELGGAGVRAVVSCPVGFVADHLEVLYDVDVEAREAAERAGVVLVRTESPNDDPAFLAVLATVVREHLAEEASDE
ncbi:MAG: ferrochelatase [Actinobacteria bacterium]|nr:ferrochelatase [Actinomycetota bacterium]